MNSKSSEENESDNNGVPSNQLKSQKRKNKFIWLPVGFSDCNRSCGPGLRAPIFRCVRESQNSSNNNKYYSPKRCMKIEKPVFNEQIYKCNIKKCPGVWKTGEWGKCICLDVDKGVSKRTVKCVKTNTSGKEEILDDKDCDESKPANENKCECEKNIRKKVKISNLLGPTEYSSSKPQIFEKNVNAGVWMTSPWREVCENSKQGNCSTGIQLRTILCDRSPPHTNLCDSNFIPTTYKFCQTNLDCSQGEWYFSEWSSCVGDCFNLHKNRLVICVHDNQVVNDNKCKEEEKPKDTVKCNISDVNFCGPRWHYSEWSEVIFI